MNPLLTFSAGLLAGVAALNLLKNAKNRVDLDTAQQRVREAGSELGERARGSFGTAQAKVREGAIAGLSALEQSSARLRSRLREAAPPTEPAAPAAATRTTRTRRSARPAAAADVATAADPTGTATAGESAGTGADRTAAPAQKTRRAPRRKTAGGTRRAGGSES